MWGNAWGPTMMQNAGWGSWGGAGLFGILGFATWIALFLFLVFGAMYFWKGMMKRDRR